LDKKFTHDKWQNCDLTVFAEYRYNLRRIAAMIAASVTKDSPGDWVARSGHSNHRVDRGPVCGRT
jgi:hypothetical protein